MRACIHKLLEYCPRSLKNLSAQVVLLTGNTSDELILDPRLGSQGLEDVLTALYGTAAERVLVYSLLRGLRTRKEPGQARSEEGPAGGSDSLDVRSIIRNTMRAHAGRKERKGAEEESGPYVNNPADALREIDRILSQTVRAFVVFQYSPVIELVGDGSADLAPALERLPDLCRARGHLVVFAGSGPHPILTQIYSPRVQKVVALSVDGPSAEEIETALLIEEVRQRRSLFDPCCLPDIVTTLEHQGRQPHSGLKTIVDNILRAPDCYLDSAWVKENGVRGLDLAGLDTAAVEQALRREIIGQEHVKNRIVRRLKHLHHFGRESSAPFLRLLFVGPSGVGKTEIAKILCRTIFGSEKPLLLVACTEYTQAHEVVKLLGAPPSYAGYGDPALLEAHRRKYPAGVLLLDEFEKAHADIHKFFMNILEEGRATSPRSEGGSPIVLDFSDYIVIATSNTGNRDIDTPAGVCLSRPQRQARYLAALKSAFAPELLGRFDHRLVFDLLGPAELEHIARYYGERQLRVFQKLCRQRGWQPPELQVEDGLYQALAAGCDRALGARNLRRKVEDTLQRLWLEQFAEATPRPAQVVFRAEDYRDDEE